MEHSIIEINNTDKTIKTNLKIGDLIKVAHMLIGSDFEEYSLIYDVVEIIKTETKFPNVLNPQPTTVPYTYPQYEQLPKVTYYTNVYDNKSSLNVNYTDSNFIITGSSISLDKDLVVLNTTNQEVI